MNRLRPDSRLIFDAKACGEATPGVSSILHLNAASAALPSAGVVDVVKAHLDLKGKPIEGTRH